MTILYVVSKNLAKINNQLLLFKVGRYDLLQVWLDLPSSPEASPRWLVYDNECVTSNQSNDASLANTGQPKSYKKCRMSNFGRKSKHFMLHF